MLETQGVELDADLVEAWRRRVAQARERLGWPAGPVVVRRHGTGASLAQAAAADQLFTATEVNEWAWCATVAERDPQRWRELEAALVASQPEAVIPAVLDEALAMTRLVRLAAAEARPALVELLAAADLRALPALLDDEVLTLGAGNGGRSFALDALPGAAAVDWSALHDIPTALVTGSNGKTTTVRLIAACARAQGWRTGYNCTDGVFVDDTALERGDYSGPAGARAVLREPGIAAVVLETARGGILRRGLAVRRARAAIITNVSADHFGEYGIDDLDALADVKLVVARVLEPQGLLVANADDALLARKVMAHVAARTDAPRVGWFAADHARAELVAHRASGGATCGVSSQHLLLAHDGVEHDLGAIPAMPLAVGGHAAYNVANLAAAALGAAALGVAPATIASVFARFGAAPGDNPGRLTRIERGGVQVLVDYAHNPDGITGVLELARRMRGGGRMALLLGQAGNRTDADIERLATVVAGFGPDLVVLKDMQKYLRGRAPGEVPTILRRALLRGGMPAAALCDRADEVAAARHALAWALPGDVVVLLVHAPEARSAVLAMLDGAGTPAR